jgi:hypothetical protein
MGRKGKIDIKVSVYSYVHSAPPASALNIVVQVWPWQCISVANAFNTDAPLPFVRKMSS